MYICADGGYGVYSTLGDVSNHPRERHHDALARVKEIVMSDKAAIRVLVVDDHALVRHGLRHYLFAYEWIETVGEAENGLKAVEYCENQEVDVVLMDLVMPVMDGGVT